MAYGPKSSWISNKSPKIFIILPALFFSIFVTIFILYFIKLNNLIFVLILLFSLYLIIQSFLDILKKTKNYKNISSFISHIGFGSLILFITLNSIMSFDKDFNIKIGEKKSFNNIIITLKDIKIFEDKNYKKFVGNIIVFYNNEKKLEKLSPEIRIYNQPETITYEASIKSKIFSDTYVTMSNISKSDYYNIKFQKKPFMNLIWLSTILIAFGGFLRIFKNKTYEN